MTLPSTTVWEVRTTGSDSNGGGWNPARGGSSVDYSQQDAAQFSGTDLVIDGATNTKVTSVTHNFVAADVGNLIQITAGTGFTTGFFEIVSVAANAATLDRSAGTLGSTGGTWAEGGALATPGKAAGVALNGNTVWVKAGTYTMTSASTNIAGGCLSTPASSFSTTLLMAWRGYTTSRSDGAPTKPIFDAGSLTNFTLITFSNVVCMIEGIELNGNGNTSGRGISTSTSGSVRRCKLTGFTNNALTGNGPFTDCVVSGCSAQPAVVVGNAGIWNNTVQSNTAGGITLNTDNASVNGCIVTGNSVGIQSPGGGWSGQISNCTVANNTSHGISNLAAQRGTIIRNTIIYGNGGRGINANVATDPMQLDNCAFGSNTSGNYQAGVRSLNEVTLTANPFTNAAAGDFSLNNTAGGGAACKAAGIPGVFPGGLTTGYLDIGAAQSRASGGASRARLQGGY